MRDLVDLHYPDAPIIRVVLDNLRTHHAGSMHEAFPPAEARRIIRRLRFHFTPKHRSWITMAEIETGLLTSQCLDRRIPDRQTLIREVAAWQQRRNETSACIKWRFGVDQARAKRKNLYPDHDPIREKKAA